VVARRGITVEKRLVTEGVDRWVVVLTVSNNNDVPVGVGLFEHLPDTIAPEDVSFDPDHLGEHWNVDRNGRLAFDISVDPEVDRRTGYAIPADPETREELLEPPEIAGVVRLHQGDEDEQPSAFVWGGRPPDAEATGLWTCGGPTTGSEPAPAAEDSMGELTFEPSPAEEAGGVNGPDDSDEPAGAGTAETVAGRDAGASATATATVEGVARERDGRGAASPPSASEPDGGREPAELSEELRAALEAVGADEDVRTTVDRSDTDHEEDRPRLVSELLEALSREVEDLVSYTEALESVRAEERSAMDALADVRSDVEELSADLFATERELAGVETTVALAEHANVVGVKDSSGGMAGVFRTIEETPDDFAVIQGLSMLALPSLDSGAAGLISGAANVFPAALSALYEAHRAGEHDRAVAIANEVANPLVTAYSDLPTAPAVKHLVGLAGHEVGPPVLPLSPLDADDREALTDRYERVHERAETHSLV
jgi:hypothetical protein